jgi:hypothetical protein
MLLNQHAMPDITVRLHDNFGCRFSDSFMHQDKAARING